MTTLCCFDCDSSHRDPLSNDKFTERAHIEVLELGVNVARGLHGENVDGGAVWRETAIRDRCR